MVGGALRLSEGLWRASLAAVLLLGAGRWALSEPAATADSSWWPLGLGLGLGLYLWTPLHLLAACLSLTQRGRWAWLLLLGLSWLSTQAPAPSIATPADAEESWQVGSWNLGRLGSNAQSEPGLSQRRQSAECAQPVLEEVPIWALQELGRQDLRLLFEGDWRGPSRFHGPLWSCAWEPLRPSWRSSAGVAVCVQRPWEILGWETRAGEQVPALYSSGGRLLKEADRWDSLLARLSGPQGELQLVSAHLYPLHMALREPRAGAWALEGAGRRMAQLLEAHHRSGLRAAQSLSAAGPGILAGDFNAPRSLWLPAALRAGLQDALGGRLWGAGTRTWRGAALLGIDSQYLRGLQLHGIEVLDRDCSDHRPVVSRVALP